MTGLPTGQDGPSGQSGPPEDRRPDDEQTGPAGALQYSQVGIEFAAAVGVCVLFGWWLDRRWGTMPLMLLIGLAVGFSAGLYRLIRLLPGGRDKGR